MVVVLLVIPCFITRVYTIPTRYQTSKDHFFWFLVLKTNKRLRKIIREDVSFWRIIVDLLCFRWNDDDRRPIWFGVLKSTRKTDSKFLMGNVLKRKSISSRIMIVMSKRVCWFSPVLRWPVFLGVFSSRSARKVNFYIPLGTQCTKNSLSGIRS